MTNNPTQPASTSPIAPLMLDIDGHTLTDADKLVIKNDTVGGMILFGRNVNTPEQVRSLCDAMRAVKPNFIIGVDQEGGRVRRLREGFTPLPAMGKLGTFFDADPCKALSLAYDIGYVLACEVLAVGIDVSFAPVLDMDGVSQVIGDRGFHADTLAIVALSSQLMRGMKAGGMATTGKHFPGHGSVATDSHYGIPMDERDFATIWQSDLQPFVQCQHLLDAVMPAHVVYPKVDDKSAGFSKVWLQDIARGKLGFDGVLFSDDLSMQAAHVAGDAGDRVLSALSAGCDMALVCNDRASAMTAIEAVQHHPEFLQNTQSHARLAKMQSIIPEWQGSLEATCEQFEEWATAKARIEQTFFNETLFTQSTEQKDPTEYR